MASRERNRVVRPQLLHKSLLVEIEQLVFTPHEENLQQGLGLGLGLMLGLGLGFTPHEEKLHQQSELGMVLWLGALW